LPTAEAGKLAENAARRALELDPDLGEAYATMALLLKNRFEYAASERLFKRAIELRPNYSLAWEWYGSALIGVGRTAEGLAMSDRAEELDPLSLRAKTIGAWLHYQSREYETALNKAEEIIRIDPKYPQGYIQRAMVLCELGRSADAVADVDRAAELMPDTALVQFNQVVVYAAAGDRERARVVLDNMLRAASEGHVKPYFLGMAHTALGEYDAAFLQFEKAYAEHEPWMLWWLTEPKLGVLKDDPRFDELSQKMNVGVDAASGFVGSPLTAVPFDAADTIIAGEPVTGGFATPIHKRRWFRRSAAGSAVVLLLFITYLTGIFSISVSNRRVVPITEANGKIAVVPFQDQTGDANNDAILRSLHSAVVERLSHTANGVVVPTFENAEIAADAAQIVQKGTELDAAFVCVTTLKREGSELRLHAKLIRVHDRKNVLNIFYAEKPERFRDQRDDIVKKLTEGIGRAIEAHD
jgi:tetratricopeptide (TPR) repeat protein/TolB-like protein